MRFGKTLRTSIYPPWRQNYIDYHKLKALLREDDVNADDSDSENSWTEQDEEAFVEELLNVQLDKVNAFQVDTFRQLRERTSACEDKLRPVAHDDNGDDTTSTMDEAKKKEIVSVVLQELDQITREVSELEKYSRINFTGFLKAAKKHDRKRGARYRVKPLLQVRLSQLPFNSEDYSPLVRRLSVMYSFVREILSTGSLEPASPEPRFGQDAYSSFKFWVHADNILEVKTSILRKLPVLIYNPQSSKDLETLPDDPTITSLYFDNPQFDLYNQKVARSPEAASLRLRWTGNLSEKPPIFLEKKVVTDDNHSREVKVQLKQKHVQEFLDGEYRLEKQVHRMEDMGNGEVSHAEALKKDIEELQTFVKEHNLQPMLRANYTRTAFQIPGDDRIRISLDTNLALIREDSLDEERPCREPNEWHRRDIDGPAMEYPFSTIGTGEIVRFPHALLEIKLKGDSAHNSEWIRDLIVSHLVKEAPRFSKFVHGVAQLFEDYVNSFPFWLGELENDIRRDPETAFHQEQERQAKNAEEDMAVGSFLGTRASPAVRPLVGSPMSRFTDLETPLRQRQSSQFLSPSQLPSQSQSQSRERERERERVREQEVEEDRRLMEQAQPISSSRLAALFPSFAKNSRANKVTIVLPPGVRHPGTWIKDAGPVRVETKVWLANQRTFIKWLHVSILLSSLSLGLYNAAGKHNDVARALSIVYTFFAVFSAAWGWYMHEKRARLIRQRSGRDLDNTFGPIVVCIGLAFALVLNFAFKYNSTLERLRGNETLPSTEPSLTMMQKPDMWNVLNQGEQAVLN